MIRQARSYLAGAVSGSAVIGVAIVAFVVLVSLQAARDWPLAGIAGADEDPVERGPAVPGQPVGVGSAAPTAGGAAGSSRKDGSGGGDGADRGVGTPISGAPAAGTPAAAAPDPGSPAPAANRDRSQQPRSAGTASGGGSSRSAAGDGGGSSPSQTATGTVDDAVSDLDAASGGAVGETGVTKATEDVVEGVAGPDSTAGSTVDETVEKAEGAVGGVVGEGR